MRHNKSINRQLQKTKASFSAKFYDDCVDLGASPSVHNSGPDFQCGRRTLAKKSPAQLGRVLWVAHTAQTFLYATWFKVFN